MGTAAIASITPITSTSTVIAGRPKPAGHDVATVMQAAVAASTFAPLFDAGQEPLSDGRVYVSRDGVSYVRADWALAERGGGLGGPAVDFLKDIDGSVLLQIELVAIRPSGAPADVGVLGDVFPEIRIVWNGGEMALPSATPLVDSTTGEARLRLLRTLTTSEVATLFGAMTDPSAGAALMVTSSFGYRVVVGNTGIVPPRIPRPFRPHLPLGPVSPEPLMVLPSPAFSVSTLARSEISVLPQLQPVSELAIDKNIAAVTLSPSVIEGLKLDRPFIDVFIEVEPAVIGPGEEARSATLVRRIAFFFDDALEQNKRIYRAITGDTDLDQDWQDTEFGVIRPAEFVNTIYLLPHEIRLAYDAARGLPHMMPVHYMADDDSARIRVLLRVEPWYDLEKVGGLQRALAAQTAGAYVDPAIISGGAVSAALSLRTVFPEEISIADAAIDLRGAVDLTLDLSEEYYSLLVTILTGPIGLTGEVAVTLRPASDTAPADTRLIPVAIAFTRMGNLPLTSEVIPEPINPGSIRVTNGAAHPVTILAAEAGLIQYDRNSMLPAAMLGAAVATPLPLRLEPAQVTQIDLIGPGEPPGFFWNAVNLLLTRTSIEIDPQVALRAIHELAPSGALGWKLKVISLQMSGDQSGLPEAERVLAVEVQLTKGDGAPLQVTILPGRNEIEVTFPRDLDDLSSSETAVAFLTLSARARGVFASGFGPWSDARDNTGETVFVFVPPKGTP